MAAVLSKLLGRTITYRELTFEVNKDAMIRAAAVGPSVTLSARPSDRENARGHQVVIHPGWSPYCR